MIRFALKSLAGRKLRTVLTALAIVLGVAMMSGAYVLTDTIDKAFDSIFVDSYAGTDAVVTGKDPGFSFEGESAQAPPIPEATLARVRQIDGVEIATGSVQDFQTKLLRPDGEAIDTGGAPSFAFGIETAPEYDRFNPLNLVEGRWPSGGTEVAIDEGVAGDEDLKLGDRIGVAALGPAQQFTIVGIAKYGDLSSIGGATFAIFDVATAQKLLDKEGRLDAVTVAAADGTTPEQVTQRIQSELGSDFTVRTGVQQADEESSEIATFTTIIRYFLLSFAGIALFVGAFVIFNTLSITVAQRTREFATLRTLGASRRQVLRSVILEALVIGLGASIVGLFSGLGLAVGLNALFKALNLDLPQTQTVFATRTIVVSLLVGTLVTLVAGLFPAIRATRVPPIAAVREGATLPRGRFARFTPYIACLVVGLSVLALGYGTLVDDIGTGDRFALLGIGVLALFIGVAMLSSRLVRPLAVGVSPIGHWLTVVVMILIWPLWTLPYWLLRHGVFGPGGALGRVGAFLLGLVNPLLVLIVLVMWVRSAVTKWQPEWPMEFPSVLPSTRINRIGRENARRNPGRTAATAAALMIGIALVTFISVLANGLRVSNSDAIERQIQSDLIITSQDGYSEFPAAVGDAVADVGGIQTVSNVRQDIAQIDGDGANLTGLDDQISGGVRLPLGGRLGRGAHAARRQRRAAAAQRRRGSGPRRRRLLHRALHGKQVEGVRRPRDLRGQPVLSRCSGRRASRRRRSTSCTSARATASRSSIRLPAARRRGRMWRARSELPRHAPPDARGVDRQGGSGDPAVPAAPLRPARPLRDHQPLRDGEHARAVRLRANAGAWDAACDRDDAAADATHGPPRERHHRADRRGARAPARDLPGRARDERARPVRPPLRVAARPADLLAVVAVIAGLVAAVTPARRAARLNPLEALQYE